MSYYVKESGWYYSKRHGPYLTLQEAMAAKPTDKLFGKEEAIVRYTVESASGTMQLLNE